MNPAAHWRHRLRTVLPLLLALILISACTRSEIPIATREPIHITAAPTPAQPQPAATQVVVIPGEPDRTYAVVWVPEGESLIVRQPAGISGVGIDSLALDRRAVRLTGKTTMLGSSQWVEIQRPGGGVGWVNGWNLTEDFAPDAFCQDTRVLDLLAKFAQAISERDGKGLAELTSPRRGLIIRHDWWNVEVPFRPNEVATIFDDPAAHEWGIVPDSEVDIHGTFAEIILPPWEDVFNAAPEVACNNLSLGSTARPARWPPEYTNLNFYSFYRPAAEPGNQLNWRTWGIGIEFVGGEPYVTVLVQFKGEI